MFKSINVEAENLELILENSHGDTVIIPANKRNWVKQKLSEGCHDCIDSLVETLPVASQYAQDGSVYPPNKKVQVYNGDVKYNVKSLAPRVGSRRNEDGTESTHLMTYSSGDNKYYAYPTLFQNDKQEWQQLDDKDDWAAFKEAKRRKEVFEFDDEKSASEFAKGSWKNNYKEYDISSPEYKNLYNSGKLMSYDKNTDTYTAAPLKEVVVTAEAPQWLKDKRKYESQYTKDWYIDNNMPKFSRSMGVSADNMHPNNVKEYDSYINDKVVEDIFKSKPTFDEDYSNDRLKTLQGFSQKELELIKNSKYASKIEPSIWSKFEQGLLSVGNMGSPVQFKNPNLTQEEAKKEDNPLNILQPLSIPSKMVQSTYKDNYSFKDALKGKQNNANIVEDIVTDPLNLVGLGIWSKLSKANKFSKLEDAYQAIKTLDKTTLEKQIGTTLSNDDWQYLYRVQEKGFDIEKPTLKAIEERVASGKGKWYDNNILNDPELRANIESRDRYYGQWFEKDPKRLDYYLADKEDIEILRTKVPKEILEQYRVDKFDPEIAKKWSLSHETEYILPKDLIQRAEKFERKDWQKLIDEHETVKGLSKESQLEKLTEQASRYEHSLKNNPNLSWRDNGDGLLKPYNTKSGKLLQEEYIDNLKSYYDSPEFKRIMQEHYPDVNIETYKQKTLENLQSPITYNPKETGNNLGVYKTKNSSDATYIPGYKPTFKQKVNNANTNKWSSEDRGKSYLRVFDATDHELSHQRTNADELLPNFLDEEFLQKNVKPEIHEELNVVKDLGENSVQYDNFKYQTKPTEFEVRLRQLKEDLKSNNINDYFNQPTTEEHINSLLKPELEQAKQETDLFTSFNKSYREAKNKGVSGEELQKIKDKYFEDLDKIKVKKHNISGDTQDLLKYYSPKFLSEMANKLPAALPFYLYLNNQNKSK